MILGVPVIDQHGLTMEMVRSLTQTVIDPTNFTLYIIDNNSDEPYKLSNYLGLPFTVKIIHYDKNWGYYYPLLELSQKGSELVGLAHNDIIFYEKGWDVRLRNHFIRDKKLGLVGFCGSSVIDRAGGRGLSTMCNFKGERGQKQAGHRVTELFPAVILDSLFMMFRNKIIPSLKIDDKIAPCHFYDKIWSLRTIEVGYHVAVLGSEIDHMGGMTACAVDKFRLESIRWLKEMNLPFNPEKDDPRTLIYIEAEKRFLTEFREQKKMMPGFVDQYYKFTTYV